MRLQVATPCPKSWDEMRGNDRVRFCAECNLNVYNLARIPRSELRALIRKKEGRFCGRLYLRGDRKAATRDCRPGRDRLLLQRLGRFAALFLLAAFGWICRSQQNLDRSQLPSWAQTVLYQVDPPQVQTTSTQCYITGIIVMDPPAPQQPPSPPAGGIPQEPHRDNP